MTPLQFAKCQCANYRQEDGGCKGIVIHDDGRMTAMPDKPKVCLLAKAGQRCGYFETTVMPFAGTLGPPYAFQNTPQREMEYAEAVRLYRKSCKLPQAAERPCPLCGRPVEPRHQFCQICSERRRKEQNRRATQKRRS